MSTMGAASTSLPQPAVSTGKTGSAAEPLTNVLRVMRMLTPIPSILWRESERRLDLHGVIDLDEHEARPLDLERLEADLERGRRDHAIGGVETQRDRDVELLGHAMERDLRVPRLLHGPREGRRRADAVGDGLELDERVARGLDRLLHVGVAVDVARVERVDRHADGDLRRPGSLQARAALDALRDPVDAMELVDDVVGDRARLGLDRELERAGLGGRRRGRRIGERWQ